MLISELAGRGRATPGPGAGVVRRFRPVGWHLAGVAAILAFFTVGPALADDGFSYFRSPTGNIHCAIMDLGDYKGARCDIAEFAPSFPRPADCDLDWGYAFEVAAAGPAGPICAGDTVRVPEARILAYGETLSRAGLTCASERTGITCRNAGGHGFTVARARQRVF